MGLTLDIFNTDAFSVNTLTNSINNPPEGQYIPTLLDSLFEEDGVTTTAIMIEREGNELALVAASERGAPSEVTIASKRDMIPFATLHLSTVAAIKADEFQNIRAFGTDNELQSLQVLVATRLQKMRQRIEATLRYHRMGAVTGVIYDADGRRRLLDLFQSFDIRQNVQAMGLNVETTDVYKNVLTAKRMSEDAVASAGIITGWMAICGRGFYDAFVGHKSVKDAFNRWNDGQFLRDDLRKGFSFCGITWQEYYGKAGNILFMGEDDAYLIPMGVNDLFITKNAPADYVETVNSVGLPFYAKQEPMQMGKGITLEVQSNPLNICTRPRSVIKLTKA